MKRTQPLSEDHQEAFRSVLAHRTMLKAYVLAIVRDTVLAEDVLQDVSIQIARSWDRYDRSRPFPEWARGVARRVALSHVRKEGRQPRLLDDQVLEAVGTRLDAFGSEDDHEIRSKILERCMDTLTEASRRLVQLRYFENRSYREIAGLVERSTTALYTAFSRIHAALAECTRKALERSA